MKKIQRTYTMSKFVTHVSVFFSDYETYLKKNDLVPRSDVS